VLARLSDAGLLRVGGRQRTDSTHVLAAVRTLNRMEFAGETLRAALEALAAAAPGWLAPLTGSSWADATAPGSTATGSPREKMPVPGGPGRSARTASRCWTPSTRPGPRAPAWLRQIPAVQTLRRAWDEQYHRDGTGVRWREGSDLPPGGQRLASPYDLDARYGVKRGAGWLGYKAHLTETCGPDMPHVITDVETTDATTDDIEMTQTIHQHLGSRRLTPDEHVTDASYISAGHILTARTAHSITLLGPVGADTHQTRRSSAGREPALAQSAFRIDWDARTVTCPQGAISISWSGQRKPNGTPIAQVHFALADCRPCPLRSRCTKAANGNRGRSLTLLPRDQHELLARQRAEQQTPQWKARYDIRAGIEGTISQAVRRTRLRRTPYRGQPKTHLASILSATAINLIRADAWLNGTPPGTTRVSHLARLDLAA
jgi:hypothetical protein